MSPADAAGLAVDHVFTAAGYLFGFALALTIIAGAALVVAAVVEATGAPHAARRWAAHRRAAHATRTYRRQGA